MGRHPTRRGAGASRYLRQTYNFNPEMECANLGGGGKFRQLGNSAKSRAYRIADADVVAALTDRAHFRHMIV